MKEELRDPQPGGALIAQQLAYMMLIQALRLHLTDGTKGSVGWLFALADKQMSAAITRMHDDPGTSMDSAETGGGRRHVSINLCSEVQSDGRNLDDGIPDTLADDVSRDKLTNSADPISAIALSLGYESESAFSKAFRRVMGCSPRQHRRGRILDSFPIARTKPALLVCSRQQHCDAQRHNDFHEYKSPYRNSRLILHEENRLPLVRSLDTLTAVRNAVGG